MGHPCNLTRSNLSFVIFFVCVGCIGGAQTNWPTTWCLLLKHAFLSTMVQCSRLVKFGNCTKINCTLRLKTKSEYNTAHHKCFQSPNYFFPLQCILTGYFSEHRSYWYVWLSKVFGEELGIVIDEIFGCGSARLQGERIQLLHRQRVRGTKIPLKREDLFLTACRSLAIFFL